MIGFCLTPEEMHFSHIHDNDMFANTKKDT